MSLVTMSTHLLTIAILLHCSSVLIRSVNGQGCVSGVQSAQGAVCFHLPLNSTCSTRNTCRARADVTPLSGAEGIEIRLSGVLDGGSLGPWIRLALFPFANDERYFNVYCKQGLAQRQTPDPTRIADIDFLSTNVSESSSQFRCHFEVTPKVAAEFRSVLSFDPQKPYYLSLRTGNLRDNQNRATLMTNGTYSFGDPQPMPTTMESASTPVRTYPTEADGSPGTAPDIPTDSKPLASDATMSSSKVWIIVVVVLLVIVAAGSIGYFVISKNKKSSRSRVAKPLSAVPSVGLNAPKSTVKAK